MAAERSAAQRVWLTEELRHSILTLVDRKTLFATFRLEKAAVVSVAEVVYRDVHHDILKKLPKESIWIGVYRDAVRLVDLSPLPLVLPSKNIAAHPPRFDPAAALKLIDQWKEALPRLNTILYRYPGNPAADAYVIHIRAGDPLVELESRLKVDVAVTPWVAPSLPSKPIFAGMEFRHTISLYVIERDLGLPRRRWEYGDAMKLYEEWLYANHDLDPRITSIIQSEFLRTRFNPFHTVTPIGQLAVLQSRMNAKCAPITSIALCCAAGGVLIGSSEEESECTLEEFLACLGPELRTLRIGAFLLGPNINRSMELLSQAFPLLEYLHIDTESPFPWRELARGDRLWGFPKLRLVIIPGSESSGDANKEARNLSGLGSEICKYRNGSMDKTQKLHFNRMVKWYRGNLPEQKWSV